MAGQAFQTLGGAGPPTAETMRQLRRLDASAVTVVTYLAGQDFRGITVSAFGVVSLAPARVLVCLASQGDALAAVRSSGRFAVNVLSDSQEFLAEQFAGRAPLVSARFERVKHRISGAGNPLLEECLVWFDCRVEAIHGGGDHAIVVGDVREAGTGVGAMPLLYFDGSYRELEAE
ncbi:MAG: flavin reductase family protein [Chloroflexota bacterium]